LSSLGISLQLNNIGFFTFKEFETKEALHEYIKQEDYGRSPSIPAVCYGFSITENEEKNKYALELHFNDMPPPQYQSIPNQNMAAAPEAQQMPLIEEYTFYSWHGFAYMQNWVANTILKRKTGKADASIVALTVPQQMAPIQIDPFGKIIENVLNFFFFLMFVPVLYRTVYRIVNEKENRAKESMRMMGCRDSAYWLSWFSYYTIVSLLLITLSWAILYPFVFPNSNGFLLWLLLVLYGQSIFGMILIIQSLFTRARAAAITTTMVYFGSGLVNFAVVSE